MKTLKSLSEINWPLVFLVFPYHSSSFSTYCMSLYPDGFLSIETLIYAWSFLAVIRFCSAETVQTQSQNLARNLYTKIIIIITIFLFFFSLFFSLFFSILVMMCFVGSFWFTDVYNLVSHGISCNNAPWASEKRTERKIDTLPQFENLFL